MLEFLKRLFGSQIPRRRNAGRPLQAGVAGQNSAEHELREREKHFEQLVAGVRDYAVFLLDRQGKILTWNTGAERIKGYRAEEIIGEHFSRLYPHDAIERGWPDEELRRAAAEGRFEDEGWRLRKDGTTFWANVVITALPSPSGEVQGFLKITRDLTGRKEAEEALRQSEERFRLLVESAHDYAIFMLDPEGRVASWNPGAERIKGYRAEEIIGQHFSRFYPQEAIDRGWPAHELEVARATGRFEDEGWRVRKDGTQFWANVIITALHDDAGKFRGFSKITRDLTERKKAEENARRLLEETTARRVAEENARLIQEQRERLHVTLASIGDGVISTDAEGRIDLLNPVAEDLIGWKSEEATRRSLSEVFRIVNEDSRQPVENPALRALQQGTVVGLANHTILVSRDGTERPIDDSAAPIRDTAGKVIGSVLVFRDISDRKRAEQQRNTPLAVTQALSQAASLEEGMVGVLRAVCESLAWDVGFLWTVADEGVLKCLHSWHRPNVGVDEFERVSCRRTFVRGEGLPGRVWESGRSAWILDIAQDENFPRLVSATSHGLHSAFACPIAVGDRTLGVVEFFTRRIRGADAGLLELMATVAGNLGQFMERKAAEDELRQSEQELADFFETATIGLHWVGPDGTILRANRAELELLGYTREEYVGRAITDFHVDPDVICDILRRLKAGEKLNDYPARLRCKDGSIKDVLIDSSVLFRDGHFIHTRCFTRDVTEHKQAEAALRESEQRFRQLADAMPQIVWTAGPDGQIDYLNRRWTEFTGLPQTVGNDAWGPLLHPADASPAYERWAASVKSGAPFEMQIRLLDRRQQTYRWHLIRTVSVHDQAGRVIRWFGTSTDIHDQKRSEESARFLAEASAALAAIVDYKSTLHKVLNLAVPYFADWAAVDVVEEGQLRRLAVSHQDPARIQFAHELVRDYPPDPQARGGIGAAFRTGRVEIVTEVTDDLLVQGAQDERHLRLMRALGLKSYICVPLVVSGSTLGVLTFATAESGRKYTEADLAVATDLAHRAEVAIENTRLYQALRETDRRKDEFLATLAHELRNPLAPIRNSLQILKMPRVDAGTLDRARDLMERQVHHLVRLVDDLLDVSRVMRGKIDLRRERVELATVIARAVETVQPLVDTQGHQLSVRLPPESLPVDADPVRLAQVVGNLLTNAAKYTEPGGTIWLTVEREGGTAITRVRDTGIGIAPEMLPRIFELFVQVDHTAARSQGGLGIGLTLVKNLVEMHNGTVEARSAGLGRGSEFVVRLPLAGQGLAADPGPAANEQPAPPQTSGIRLLVVDDNHDAANSLAMLLRLQGHQVRVAYSGVAALEMTKDYRPDVVFLDIGMPGMDGYEVARRLRQQPGLENVVLAALTGWGQQEDRRRSAEAGFNNHLVKPPDPRSVEALLADLKRIDAP